MIPPIGGSSSTSNKQLYRVQPQHQHHHDQQQQPIIPISSSSVSSISSFQSNHYEPPYKNNHNYHPTTTKTYDDDDDMEQNKKYPFFSAETTVTTRNQFLIPSYHQQQQQKKKVMINNNNNNTNNKITIGLDAEYETIIMNESRNYSNDNNNKPDPIILNAATSRTIPAATSTTTTTTTPKSSMVASSLSKNRCSSTGDNNNKKKKVVTLQTPSKKTTTTMSMMDTRGCRDYSNAASFCSTGKKIRIIQQQQHNASTKDPYRREDNNNSRGIRYENVSHTVPRFSRIRQRNHDPYQDHHLEYYNHNNTNSDTYNTPQNQGLVHQHQHQQETEPTAITLSKQATYAGFLHKLGSNIQIMKRRFFILSAYPGPYLYYYLNEHDTQPRGCIHLHGSHIVVNDNNNEKEKRNKIQLNHSDDSKALEEIEQKPYSFTIIWENTGHEILLQARNETIGKKWVQQLNECNIDYIRKQYHQIQNQYDLLQNDYYDIKKECSSLQHIEKDRDGAIEDAYKWKEQFIQLDTALHELLNYLKCSEEIRKTTKENRNTSEVNAVRSNSLETTTRNNTTAQIPLANEIDTTILHNNYQCNIQNRSNSNNNTVEQEKIEKESNNGCSVQPSVTKKGDDIIHHETIQPNTEKNHNTDDESPLNKSLLDDDDNDHDGTTTEKNKKMNTSLDENNVPMSTSSTKWTMEYIQSVPGTNFFPLYQCIEELLHTIESTEQDAYNTCNELSNVNDQIHKMEHKMNQAEKHLCDIWEENCSIRKVFKQTKREKRVLVREVKNLLASIQQNQQNQQKLLLQQQNQQQHNNNNTNTATMNKSHHHHRNKSPKSITSSSENGKAKLYNTNHPNMKTSARDYNDDDDLNDEQGQKLIDELEEHVLSSIRLNEQFMLASSSSSITPKNIVRQPPYHNNKHGLNNNSTFSGSNIMKSKNYSNHNNLSVQSAPAAIIQEQRTTTSEFDYLDTSIDTDFSDIGGFTPRHNNGTNKMKSIQHSETYHKKKMASLLDGSDDDDDDEKDEQGEGDMEEEEVQSVASLLSSVMISSVGVEAAVSDTDDHQDQNNMDDILEYDHDNETVSSKLSPNCCFDKERPNPLLQLDDDNDDLENMDDHFSLSERSTPQLSQSDTSSFKSKGVCVNMATTKLECPLADVVSTTTTQSSRSYTESSQSQHHKQSELQVYHLTFHTRKIGIQFMKVPPPPLKARGLLTEAMTTDIIVTHTTTPSNDTALQRIESISDQMRNKQFVPDSIQKNATTMESASGDRDHFCAVATPIDAVLVCGFHGFDENCHDNEMVPKLGARLVAFDGISVEIGKWTFHAIRKAIHARHRPLTLSFRNDFLTTEQRALLTRAIAIAPIPQLQQQQQQPSPNLSLPDIRIDPYDQQGLKTSMKEDGIQNELPFSRTVVVVDDNDDDDDNNKRFHRHVDNNNDDEDENLSVSVFGSDSSRVSSFFPTSFSGSKSVMSTPGNYYHSHHHHHNNDSGSGGITTGRNNRFHFHKSFSDAGTMSTVSASTSVFSAVVPTLVSNLLNRSRTTSNSSKSTSQNQKNRTSYDRPRYHHHYLQSIEPFTPEYLRRAPESVENTPQHQEYQSELL